MAGFDNDVVYGTNADFSNALGGSGASTTGELLTDGQLWIGSTALNAGLTHINVGTLTSPDSSVTIGYSSPNITLTASASIPTTFTADSGSAVPVANTLVIVGSTTSAGTSPLVTTGGGNTITIVAQRSQAIAAGDATRVGLSNFDSTKFTVSAAGFVSTSGTGVGNTITGNDGTPLSPTAGNWDIFGRSGSKTSGLFSTLTIKSPPYADEAGSTTVTLNSGSFATNAITLTTPASAGLLDGDLLEFVATNGVLVIQLAATQVAHLGSSATSAAGTLTSTATGDSISLRYQASTNDWWATSSIGNWTVA
jgi:hypothetical protein